MPLRNAEYVDGKGGEEEKERPYSCRAEGKPRPEGCWVLVYIVKVVMKVYY